MRSNLCLYKNRHTLAHEVAGCTRCSFFPVGAIWQRVAAACGDDLLPRFFQIPARDRASAAERSRGDQAPHVGHLCVIVAGCLEREDLRREREDRDGGARGHKGVPKSKRHATEVDRHQAERRRSRPGENARGDGRGRVRTSTYTRGEDFTGRAGVRCIRLEHLHPGSTSDLSTPLRRPSRPRAHQIQVRRVCWEDRKSVV